MRAQVRNKPGPLEANLAAFRAGWSFGETSELIDVQVKVDAGDRRPAGHVPQRQRHRGDRARADRRERQAPACRWCSARYPITPASDLLHALVAPPGRWACGRSRPRTRSRRPSMALGAAFGGALGVTATSGPGLDLKTETIGLAVMLELPMVDHRRPARRARRPACRPRPSSRTCCRRSTGATASRRCRSSPPSTPGQCFEAVYEAARIAVTYRTPVILLSDLFVANSSEPWRIPGRRPLPPIDPRFRRADRRRSRSCPTRATTTLARPWAIPGHARARAPHRRAREAGRDGRDLLRRPQPRAHDRAARGKVARHRRCPTSRSTATKTPTCWCSAGARATGRSAPARAACASAAAAVATAHLHHLHPMPPTSARCCAATSACSCRR